MSSVSGRLDGKVAIVTAGAQGQGAAIVRHFVAEGAKVVIADIAKEEGQALADELGGDTHFADHDVSDAASWARVVEDTNERFGAVNVLANNAGILRFGDIERQPAEEVELLWRINQLGCFLGMQAVTRTMRKNGGGSIINASSVEGLAGMASCTAYAATKWAIRGMTKCAAMELGPSGVPLRRVGYPEDIAPLYVFLASDESSYINGAEISIDGGVTATHAFGG